jgi:(p)ppGpp synthase/HD superfamily hydrolase
MTPDTARKRRTALRYYLQGTGFSLAQEALELALRLHDGTRKDKVTPEWAHPMTVTLYLTTLAPTFGRRAEHILAASLLHDVLEDKPFTIDEMRLRFGVEIANTVVALSHKQRLDPEAVREKAAYYARMHLDPAAGIIKAADRIHNLGSMVGVFTHEKQVGYVWETRQHILPMLKRSREHHPSLMLPLQNAKLVLEGQCDLLDAVLQNTPPAPARKKHEDSGHDGVPC